jgi:hypothetical protein
VLALTAAVYDEKKFETAACMFPGRWKSYRNLEHSAIFYKVASKMAMSDGTIFFEALRKYCQETRDVFSTASTSKFTNSLFGFTIRLYKLAPKSTFMVYNWP